jgi:hypothetical protein
MTTTAPEWAQNGAKTKRAVISVLKQCEKIGDCLILRGPTQVHFRDTTLTASKLMWYYKHGNIPKDVSHICGANRCCKVSHMVNTAIDRIENKSGGRKACRDANVRDCEHYPKCIATPKIERAPKRKRKIEDEDEDVEPCEADDLDQPVASRKGRRTVGKFSKYE